MDGESWEISDLTNGEVAELKKALNRKTEQIKRFKKGREYARLEKRNAELREELVKARQRIDWYSDKLRVQYSLYDSLSQKYVRLDRKFEANFKFHEYIRDVLDQTADFMENPNALCKQIKTVQKRVQTAGRKGRTRQPDGAATRTS